MNSQPLHPDHLDDLRRSGLSDETIRAAGVYTLRPADIGKKLGGGDVGVASLLAFPYPGCDGFERYRCFYEDGKTGPKYRQPKGALNRLYIPPGVELAGDDPLIITEGEKKALKLTQEGFPAAGIGGVWSWLTKGDGEESKPIDDFGLVNWNRPVTIIFDSDGTGNHMVRLAAFRLAREISRREATVSILFLPSGENGEKMGADDLLVAHGPEALGDRLKTAWPFDPSWGDREAEVWWQVRDLTPDTPKADTFERLAGLAPTLARTTHLEVAALMERLKERLGLRTKDLNGLAADIKAARKAKETKEKKTKGPAPDVKDLEEGFRLHPAVDFLEEAMSIGFRVSLPENDTGLLLLVSDGQGVKAEVNPDTVEIGERAYQVMQNTAPPLLGDVWGLPPLKAFLDRPNRPHNLYGDLVTSFKTYLDLPETAYGLLAAWTVGTYFAHLFTAFPFLHFHGPKESGKSKSLEALKCVCCNPWKGRDITPAALGDTMDGQRGTLLLDQAERLNSDKENGNLIGLLADSYKKAGGKRRVVEVTKAGRSVLEFSTYGPKAFASTKALDPDLDDRCVKVPMTRTMKKLPDLEGWEPVWSELRDKLYRFILAAFREVKVHYREVEGNGTRIGELWRPLGAVLMALRVEQEEIDVVRALFMAGTEEGRHELTSWELALFEALKNKSDGPNEPFEMSAQEIIEVMNVGDDGPGPKWIGEAISRFHLATRRKQRRMNGKRTRVYEFSPDRLKELWEIYSRDEASNDPCHLCQDGKACSSGGLYGPGEKCGTCANPCHSEEEEHMGTGAKNSPCATEGLNISEFQDMEQVEQVEIREVPKINSQPFSDDDLSLLGGEI